MLRDNHDIYLTQGEANVTHTFTFYDDDGRGIDLSDPGWSARLYVGKKNTARIIDGEAMTVLPDQVNYRGKISFMFTSTHAANTRGQYEMSAVIRHTDGRKFEFPKTPNEQFGVLHIIRSKTNS